MCALRDLPHGIPAPPHAHVPGVNARHAEDWFDQIKQSVTPEIPATHLHLTAAWTTGIAYLKAGYFWECHEVLEAVWMQTRDGTAERDMVQALIQLANARLKQRMGRPQAAWRLCNMVHAHLSRCPIDRAILGLNVPDVQSWVRATEAEVRHQK